MSVWSLPLSSRGLLLIHKKRRLFAEALDAIGKVSFAFFIPIYFAIVGLKLDLIRGLSLWMDWHIHLRKLSRKIFCFFGQGESAGFRGLDLINLAITTNARGGPGIVLASVAFDAGIISPQVLYHSGYSSCTDFASGWRMARLRAPQGLAVADSAGQPRLDRRGNHGDPVGSLKATYSFNVLYISVDEITRLHSSRESVMFFGVAVGRCRTHGRSPPDPPTLNIPACAHRV